MKTSKAAMAAIALGMSVLSAPAWAQPANHNPGMRGACAADIEKVCAGVQPGQPTMQCVMKNRDKMSDGCKQAMAAMNGQGMGQSAGGMSGQAMGKDEAMEKGKGMMKEKGKKGDE